VFAEFEDHLDELRTQRGRYPVSNLLGDYLKSHPRASQFKLGHWLASLDGETLEDIQTKLDQFLAGGGPDHAGEDLIVTVDLLTAAEMGKFAPAGDDTKLRLLAWFEAGLMSKLSRAGLVRMTGVASIDPNVPCPVQVPPEVLQLFAEQPAQRLNR
jgi:hypothetical protein